MKKTVVILMSITIFSKLFGMARDIVLTHFYGASNISDAYLISLTIPTVIFSLVATGISTGYIPMYSKVEQTYGPNEGTKFTNSLINMLILICTFIVIIGILFTEQIVKVFASGFEGETLALAIQFTRISLFGIYITGIVSIFTGYLQFRNNFNIPALIGIPTNILVILSIFISAKTNDVLILILGTVFATFTQLFIVLPYVYKKGFKYSFVFDFKNKYVKEMAFIALPVIIGVSINQINVLIDRTLASQIVVGGISVLTYANKLIVFIIGIFVVSITTVIYPKMSKMAANGNMMGLKKSLSEAISGVNLIIIPATIGTMIFSKQIVEIIYGRGAFDTQAVALTSNALFYYSIGMIGLGFREVLSRAFYSLQDTKTPMINATIAVIINIVLNMILSKYLGIGGLALATSISAIFCSILLYISLRKKIGRMGINNIMNSFVKILISSLVMGTVAKVLYSFFIKYINYNISLIISIILAAVCYLILIFLLKVKNAEEIAMAIKQRIKK